MSAKKARSNCQPHPASAVQDGGIGRREALRWLTSGAAMATMGIPAASAMAAEVRPDGTYVSIPPFFCAGRPRPDLRSDTTAPALDPFNDIKAVFDAGVSLIPGIGGPLRIFMDLFWPSDQPELSTLITRVVQALIDTSIQQTVLDNLVNLLGHAGSSSQLATGLNGALGVYQSQVGAFIETPDANNRDTVKNGAMALHTFFTGMAGSFAPASEPFADWQQQILPYFAQFANLHLVFLRDLVWHGSAVGVDGKPGYGFDDNGAGSTMDQFRNYFHTTRDQYVQYASDQITAIANSLEQHYQSQRGNYEDNSPYGLEEYIMVATGAWYAKKKQNGTNSQMIHLVQDYRDLWQVMDQPNGNAVRLTRELVFGPYGAPDLQDIGLPGDGSGSPPDVPSFSSSPGQSLYYISAGFGALITQGGRNFNFPSAIATTYSGDPLNGAPYAYYGIRLDDQGGGPVVGVTVDIGHYASRTSNPFSNFDNTAGYLVASIGFTQKNGATSWTSGANRVGWEMKSYANETIDVPSGHMLSGISTPTSVFALYEGLGKTPTALTYHSIGSVTFGFRLIDPDLKLTLSLAKSLYVTASDASINDVHQTMLQAYARKGAQLSSQQAATLLAQLESAWERFQWDKQREMFLRRIAAAGSNGGA